MGSGRRGRRRGRAGRGIGDRATLDYLGAVLGDEEIDKVSTPRQCLELDLGSRTYSKDFRRLTAPDRRLEKLADLVAQLGRSW